MISNISEWTRNIVIATIAVTMIEMILPENKNKKYIKVVLGIFILFTIITPVVGKSIKVNLNEYIDEYSINIKNNNSNENENSVMKKFKSELIKSISEDLKENGFESNNINLIINNDYEIKSITIKDIKKYNNQSKTVNKVVIDTSTNRKENMTNDWKELKYKLHEKYNVKTENILIE